MASEIIVLSQPHPNGPYVETRTPVVVVSSGAADAAKPVFTASNGMIDPSLLPASSLGAGALEEQIEQLTATLAQVQTNLGYITGGGDAPDERLDGGTF